MNKKQTDPNEILKTVSQLKSPVCFIDSRIDMDAVCSVTALYNILKEHFNIDLKVNYQKTVSRRFHESAGDFFTLPPINENVDLMTYDFSQHDAMFFLDTGTLAHVSATSEFEKPNGLTVIDIDHHNSNVGYGDLNYVKPYGSACTVLYELLKNWNLQLSTDTANSLLMGIMMDTGFFQYNSTSDKDFDYAAELIRAGARQYAMVWNLTFNEDLEDTKLTKLIYKNLRILPLQKVAYTTISLQDLHDMDINLEDTVLSPSDVIKKIKGTDFVFSVRETDTNGNYNISLRSHVDSYNVAKLSKALNPLGGGHDMAASAIIKANSMELAVNMVLDTAAELMRPKNS